MPPVTDQKTVDLAGIDPGVNLGRADASLFSELADWLGVGVVHFVRLRSEWIGTDKPPIMSALNLQRVRLQLPSLFVPYGAVRRGLPARLQGVVYFVRSTLAGGRPPAAWFAWSEGGEEPFDKIYKRASNLSLIVT
jgi:hypothetical protein